MDYGNEVGNREDGQEVNNMALRFAPPDLTLLD